MERLAQDIALGVPNTCSILLNGDLGAGKTTFARGFIRCLMPHENEIPSPTYSIVQTYTSKQLTILHSDLYRISSVEELDELGLFEETSERILLVEWPEKAANAFDDDCIDIQFTISASGQRHIELSCPETMGEKLARSLRIRAFINESHQKEAERQHLIGDASARSYEYCSFDDQRRILMNSPHMPDGAPIKDGKPYSRLAHLAESITPYIAITKLLEEKGFTVPHITAADHDQGFALLDDLGQDGLLVEGIPQSERYALATSCLVQLHKTSYGEQVQVTADIAHEIPSYDFDALIAEIELFTSWYLPFQSASGSNDTVMSEFVELWSPALTKLANARETLVLRDFHSPNILWQAQKEGIGKIGLIDFQDAVIGPCAYDVASLLQDARVTISDEMETELRRHYCDLRKDDPSFDEHHFRELYAICAAQRATKILGIFVRLSKRDQKHQYLNHLPRIRHYLEKSLEHPTLASLKVWYSHHLAQLS